MAARRLLGFDYGLRRIGVAVGETLTGSTRPLETLHCAQPGQVDWTAIDTLIADWEPDALVVGLPRRDDGTEGEMAQAARRFARRLQGRFGLPVHLMDERLSSFEAEQRLQEAGGRIRRQPGAADMIAASIILEAWLQEHAQ